MGAGGGLMILSLPIDLRKPRLIEEHPDDMQLHGAVCPLLAVPVSAAKSSKMQQDAAMLASC